MLIFLFSILWGAIIALMLCAPYGYYPILITASIISIALFIYTKKLFTKIKPRYYIISILPLIISYSLCSFFIFDSPNQKLVKNKNLSANKRAIIFYCDGEMEKYSPKYTNHLIKDTNLLLKPFYAYKIKKAYRNIDPASKNSELLKVAKETRNSILNYKPYFFYIAFSSYYPDIHASIQNAINDGCSEITIVNYTNIPFNEASVDKVSLKHFGISLNITKPVYHTENFQKAIISKITNMNIKYDGILLIDDKNETSEKIKSSLVYLGFEEKNIIIDKNIAAAMDIMKKNQVKNLLYINLLNSSDSYISEIELPSKFENYAYDMKITGLGSWGYDKYLVKSVIELIKK